MTGTFLKKSFKSRVNKEWSIWIHYLEHPRTSHVTIATTQWKGQAIYLHKDRQTSKAWWFRAFSALTLTLGTAEGAFWVRNGLF